MPSRGITKKTKSITEKTFRSCKSALESFTSITPEESIKLLKNVNPRISIVLKKITGISDEKRSIYRHEKQELESAINSFTYLVKNMKKNVYEIIFLTLDGSQHNRPGGQNPTQHSIGFINYIDENNVKNCVFIDCLISGDRLFSNFWYSDLLKGIKNKNPELVITPFNNFGNLEGGLYNIGCPDESEGICNALTIFFMAIFLSASDERQSKENFVGIVLSQIQILDISV